MEDVLDLYARPFDPQRPLVCFDERNKEQHIEVIHAKTQSQEAFASLRESSRPVRV